MKPRPPERSGEKPTFFARVNNVFLLKLIENVYFVGFFTLLWATVMGYSSTLFFGVPGGDSGELVAMSCAFGTAHPPGYPLLVLLGNIIFKAQASFGNLSEFPIVLWFNIFNMLIGIGASLALFHLLSISKVITRPIIREVGAVVGALMFAFNPAVWEYASGFEVFALNNFICVVLLIQTWRCLDTPLNDSRLRYGAFLCGLGLSNQHTIVLYVVPLVGAILYERYRAGKQQAKPLGVRLVFGYAVYCFMGLLPYLQLIISRHFGASSRGSWGDPGSSLNRLIRHFLRADYGTFRLFAADTESLQFVERLTLYFVDLFEHQLPNLLARISFVVGVLSVLLGLPTTKNTNQKFLALMLLTFLFYILVFHWLSNMPIAKLQPHLSIIRERFWQQPFIIVTILTTFGFGTMANITIECVKERYKRLQSSFQKRISLVLLGTVFMAVLLHQFNEADLWFRSNRGLVRQASRSDILNQYSKTFMGERVPKNSIVLISGDLEWTLGQYIQHCEQRRLDVTLLNAQTMSKEWFSAYHTDYPTVPFPGTHLDMWKKSENASSPTGTFSLQDFLNAVWDLDPHRLVLFTGDTRASPISNTSLKLRPYGAMLRLCPSHGTSKDCAGEVFATTATTQFWASQHHFRKGTWEWFARLRYWQRLKFNMELLLQQGAIPVNVLEDGSLVGPVKDTPEDLGLKIYESLLVHFPDLVAFGPEVGAEMPMNMGIMYYNRAKSKPHQGSETSRNMMAKALYWWRIGLDASTVEAGSRKHPSHAAIESLVKQADEFAADKLFQSN